MVIKGELEGFDEFLKVLNTLGDEKKVNELLKKTNRESLKRIQKSMQSGLPFAARLKKEIRIRAAKVDGNRHPNAIAVGPTSDAFPMRFLDKGTVDRYTKAGAYRGRIIGKNAVEPFLYSKAQGLQQDVIKNYGEDLVKVTAKDVKRINKKR